MKIEHSLLRPKTNLHRLKEGDANSKYFHGLLRGKGRRMFMHKLLTDNGQWFKVMIILLIKLANILNIFSLQNNESISEDLLYCIPNIVTLEKNSILESVPSMEVHREVVSAINPNYAPG